MMGNRQFTDPIGTTPPDFYRTYHCGGTWTYNAAGAPDEVDVIAGVGDTNIGFAADGTSLGGDHDATETITNEGHVLGANSTDNLNLAVIWGIFSPPLTTTPFGWGPGSNVITLAVVSATEVTVTQPTWSSGGDSTSGGVITFTLTDKDLDADAVARAIMEEFDRTAGPDPADLFSADIYSLWEARYGIYASQFSYAAGTYQLNCAGLVAGIVYHYVVVWEQRTAAGDGTGDESHYGSSWTNSDSQSGDFTASDTTHNVTGLTIPVAQGFQKRIKSITITPVGV